MEHMGMRTPSKKSFDPGHDQLVDSATGPPQARKSSKSLLYVRTRLEAALMVGWVGGIREELGVQMGKYGKICAKYGKIWETRGK